MKKSYIELLGEKHPMCFSLSAVEALCDEFGDIKELPARLKSGTLGDQAKTLDKILCILLNAGRKYCEIAGEELPEKLKCRPADVLDISEMKDSIAGVFEIFANDAKREVEAKTKNAEPTPDN